MTDERVPTFTAVMSAIAGTLVVLGIGWQIAAFAINLRRDVDDIKARQLYEHGDYTLLVTRAR